MSIKNICHYIASAFNRRRRSTKRSRCSTAMSAIRKLAQNETNPSKYTKEEIDVLTYIAHDKFQRGDIPLIDIETPGGLLELSRALYSYHAGYKHYMNELAFGEED